MKETVEPAKISVWIAPDSTSSTPAEFELTP